MTDTTHVGQGDPQNRLFKQIGTTAEGDPILAEYVALEPGSIGGGGGGVAGSVTIADGTVSTQKAAVSAAGAVKVDGSGATQPISGTVSVGNFPGTQPVSGSVAVTNFPATQPVSLAASTPDVTDRAARLLGHVTVDSVPTTPVTGTFFQATQPVSLAVNTPDVTDRSARLLGHVTVDSVPTTPVTGTFFQATQPVSIAATVNDNVAQVGGVAVAATAKGTQGANLIPTQDAKDAGRVAVTLFLDAVAGITTEALGTMGITKGGVAQATSTSYTVTAGKTLRISGLHTTVKNTSTVASDSRVRVRQGAGSVTVASPIVLLNEAGSPAAIATAAGTDDTVMPDGFEIAGGQTIGISHLESATTCTISVVLVGYEY